MATITRGSKELKNLSDESKQAIMIQMKKSIES
ncbi:hypothetical protein N9R79_11715 [Vibrio sp.]|nr:hypothetical protein [Vibrio sp.]